MLDRQQHSKQHWMTSAGCSHHQLVAPISLLPLERWLWLLSIALEMQERAGQKNSENWQ
jgi:hypothetical protein